MTEANLIRELSIQNNDMPVHKFILMEKLDLVGLNPVRILYYQNPSRFYVYLRQRIHTHAALQIELQRAMEQCQLIPAPTQYVRFQPIVAQDNHAIWHRATIIDINLTTNEVYVYFVDVGQQENVSIKNIRPLPQEFIRQPAFAIPCRLYKICPLNGDEQTLWKLNDPVHETFNQLMADNANCKVCDVREHICYDVDIAVPKVGDLGKYLLENNLVSRVPMRTSQSTPYNTNPIQQSAFDRVPPGFSAISPSVQLQSLTPTNEFYTNPTSNSQQTMNHVVPKPTVQPTSSSSMTNDFSSDIKTVPPQDGHYIVTHVYNAIEFYGHFQGRERELEAFHQRLEDIFNNNNPSDQSLCVDFLMEGIACAIQQGDKYHRVIIKHRESESKVLVKLVDRGDEMIVDISELLQLDKRYFSIPAFAQPFRLYNYDESHNTANITRKLKRLILNQRVHITQHLPKIKGFHPVEVRLPDNRLVNEILLSNDINPPIVSPPMKLPELQTSESQPDLNSQRINDDLPAPQKLLTASSTVSNGRTQPGRFMAKSSTDEPISRFSRVDQQEDARPVEQQSERFPPRTTNRFQQFPNQRHRSSSRGFVKDEQQTNRRNEFRERSVDNNNENILKRTGGFSNNRFGTSDNHDRFQNRNDDNNNDPQRFANRGRFNGDRGNRFTGFRTNRDRENNGDNDRRGGRGGPRGGRGGFSDRGNRGSFGNRGGRDSSFRGGRTGGFGEQNENAFQSNSNTNEPIKTFSGWPNAKPVIKSFESGDHFVENVIPKEEFRFVLSHIETPNDFFIQIYSKADELTALSDKLQNEYVNAPELNSSEINKACLAKSSDQCWYRAIILSTNFIQAKVRFIDFGDTLDVEKKSLKQIEKDISLIPPYAYRCSLENCEANENVENTKIIEKCAEQIFNGKIEKKLSNEKFSLESNGLKNLLTDINAIKIKQNVNTKYRIVYIDSDKYEFYVQNDEETMNKINNELSIASESLVNDIELNQMVISNYNEKPARAIIQSDLDENVRLYFVDYGCTKMCTKTLLKTCSENLKSYPHQAKKCQLYDVSASLLDQAFKNLHESFEVDDIDINIINQCEDLLNVLVYINGECLNQKFNQQSISLDENESNNDQSSTTTATTVKEQEKPFNITGKRNSDEILSPVTNSLNQTTSIKRQKSESETGANPIEYHHAILTYNDQNQPIIYVQLLPESESILGRINDLIDDTVKENKHNPSYKVDEHVIAQFTDDLYYRAQVLSYSNEKNTYTVYFLDYGNVDEDVPQDRLCSYSDELKQIEPLAQKYTIEKISNRTWVNKVLTNFESKVNEEIEFYFIDKTKNIIHVKLDNENDIYQEPKTFTANISAVNKDCFYIHILPDANALICEMDELLQNHNKQNKLSNSWSINDRCIVYDNELNQYFRGKIRSINNDKYDVQYIDHGNIILNVTNDNLYILDDNNFLQQVPLARQCRLYGVNNKNQEKAIKEIIQHINPTERVTITVENDQNEECMNVMLFRENHDIVNDRYRFDDDNDDDKANKECPILANTSDSAIAADDEISNSDGLITKKEQHLISPIGIPQAESTHNFVDAANVNESNRSLSSMTMNQSIDFGENDPSTTNTLMKDDSENED